MTNLETSGFAATALRRVTGGLSILVSDRRTDDNAGRTSATDGAAQRVAASLGIAWRRVRHSAANAG
jgi:hypothetical protein